MSGSLGRRSGLALVPAVALVALPVLPVTPEGAGAPGGAYAAGAAYAAGRAVGAGPAGAAQGRERWRGGWAAAPQRPTDVFGPNWSTAGFARQTVRQVVRISTGGTQARIKLSNRYGTAPLKVAGATLARGGRGAALQPGSVRQLTFGHGKSATIPAGGELLSDGVGLKLRALESVTVTLYFDAPTGPATFHGTAFATSYRAAGDHRADTGAAAFTETSQSWYYLSGVEVAGGPGARRDGVAAFGDSITDGFGSTPGANRRYPDVLAERFAAAGRPRSVLNEGISGNQLTKSTDEFGEKAVARFPKDVLNEPGVGTVIVLEGINDIGMSEGKDGAPGKPSPNVTVDQLIGAQRELIRQAHRKGIKVIGATLTPFKGAEYYSERGEAKRDALNRWIRTSGEFDGVVDLDRALADPADRDRLAAMYDAGDHLHPNDAGYRAMAGAIDLRAL
ncbi:G-D-S-L family lipolytic protein [Streptomyces sp. NRRL F-4489]|uniref:SGNH/GDSL hydrolase family protein n=1 Tax=Streptomyces sp. NRRL F-4489 TaxID=1609095 RepID=UPI0007470AD4|nr:SGNH/GDSL hydrolase family protein [Streptomyces sp. NRRL F-4489]KUL35112.1 G-D-S-L family lipolytic protein [Streptomyces sp. NRRL F-4489]